MTKRKTIFGYVAGAAIVTLFVYGLIFPSDKLRQKIIVEVETPYGLRTGSSVVETRVEEGKSWGDSSGTSFYLKGEAVAVDLPGNKTIFALLRVVAMGDPATYQASLIMDALHAGVVSTPPIMIGKLDLMQARAAASAAKIRLDLPVRLYPTLVRFRDVTDPLSVELVSELEGMTNETDSTIRIRRITVEVTHEAVTNTILSILPWLARALDNSLDNRDATPTPTPTLAQLIRQTDFRKGFRD